MLASGLGVSSAAGAALAGGLANSALQVAGGGKFNILEALTSAGGAYVGAGGLSGTPNAVNAANITTSGVDAAANAAYNTAGVANPTYYSPEIGTTFAGAGPSTVPVNTGIANAATYNPEIGTTFAGPEASLTDKVMSYANRGIDTISNLGSEALDYVKNNKMNTALTAANLVSLGAQLGMPRNEGEDDDSYAKRLAETQGYITQYGKNLNITNPYFYQKEGAVNPFAPTMAANGGIMGYAKGGSMVPPARQIEGGVIELDARKSGGYIPYGKKERVDDVPAMLAKDEFVFTSRAVKAAGGGSAQKGAEKMYALMKQLESKGARA
jgi:hypothetical protein